VQFFPLTRKSMGGVAIDRSCRVIDILDRPITGLYAVGELTGLQESMERPLLKEHSSVLPSSPAVSRDGP